MSTDQEYIRQQLAYANDLIEVGNYQGAVDIYREALQGKHLPQDYGVNFAHALVLSADWGDISRCLPSGINYLQTSGWLNSLRAGHPVNQVSAPIPWYTYPAIEFIEDKVESTFRVFEYGSGCSTLWWAKATLEVVAVESYWNWYSSIRESMPSNVQLMFIEDEEKYAHSIEEFPDYAFDVIIIDGANRNRCTECSLKKLKPDGFIIFDNTDSYQFDAGVELLSDEGFNRIDFYGMSPGYTYKNCTSIFFKGDKLFRTKALPSRKESCLGKSCFQVVNSANAPTQDVQSKPVEPVIF